MAICTRFTPERGKNWHSTTRGIVEVERFPSFLAGTPQGLRSEAVPIPYQKEVKILLCNLLTVAYKLLILVVQVVKQPDKQLMAIPSVIQGTVETEGGKVFELDSPKGAAWVETIGSFRYEPVGDGKPYTVRREASGYWYGCRKVAGKVRKKYIGKSSELIPAKLDEIAVALEDSLPPVPRVKKVAEVAQGVAEVAQGVVQGVAEVAEDRLATLESEVAMLRQAVEALQEALPGKSEVGDSEELPKVDSEVAEELQNELSNLKAENEKLKQELVDTRTDYAQLLESSGQIKASREKEIAELQSQLEQERADREEVEVQLSELKQKSATARELPEAAEILNQLKSKRKKSKTDLADLEAILEILESRGDKTLQLSLDKRLRILRS